MINPQCKLCQQGVGDTTGSHAEVARQYEVSEGSVRRHRKHWKHWMEPVPPWGTSPTEDLRAASSATMPGDPEFAGIPGHLVTARGASILDPETGSWYKVSWKPNAVALHQALTYDDISPMFDEPVQYPPEFAFSEHAEVLNLSDLQIGKAHQRGGGTPETIAKFRKGLAKFVRRCEDEKPRYIVLADGGDPIENIFNVPSQPYTNDMDVSEQIRTFRKLFAEAIRAVAPLAPHVYAVSVPSNHGAVRSGPKAQAGTTDADFGLDINFALEEIFAEREGYEHVRFVRPDLLEETAVLEVAGTVLAFNHGHHSGGPHKQSLWWARQDHGRRPGWDADIFVFAHYHTFNVGHSGDGRWIISVSSTDPGSDWFTNATGEAALSGMTAFAVHNGQWSNLAIL